MSRLSDLELLLSLAGWTAKTALRIIEHASSEGTAIQRKANKLYRVAAELETEVFKMKEALRFFHISRQDAILYPPRPSGRRNKGGAR